MSGVRCDQVLTMQPGESLLFGISFAPLLDSGETLDSGADVSKQSGETDLTIASVAINTAAFTDINGDTVAIGEGIQFRASTGLDGQVYILEATAVTSSGNTRQVDVRLEIKD